ncbi:MAG: putative lipid II flippase FtsW [Gammaproteobacteria bacterium]|nr:putative lipid II flippase FtsW [Gammaproteobacteria bacterium]
MTNLKTTKYGSLDRLIEAVVLILMATGAVFVVSACANLSSTLDLRHFYGFTTLKQILFFPLAIVVMYCMSVLDYRRFSFDFKGNASAGKSLTPYLLVIAITLLTLVLIPGIGIEKNYSRRWLELGVGAVSISFQPSELAKFSLAVYLAYSMSKKGSNMGSFSKGFLPHIIIAGAFMLLIVLQPDLGTAVIMGCWFLIVLFVGGVKFTQLSLSIILSAPFVVWMIWSADYRLKRLWAFIHPWDDPQGVGFQIIHSFLAFGSGGIFGTGLGNSKQKLFYLPEPHTDFVFSIAAEELGFIGVIVIIVLFGILIMRGIKIALNATDLYSSYLALGLTCLIGLQVMVNMAVVMGLLPTKGLTLPLISYGGSSLVLNLLSIGILLSISSRT